MASNLAVMVSNTSFRSFGCFKVVRICNETESASAGCYKDEESASRFQDNEELRYSLRSVWKFAPWVRNIYIVTNGQIPAWLNVQHPRIHLIPHETIFANMTHLPTFSSPAIEANLHRIPGLSEHFLYLNDDVMFGRPITPSDFYTQGNGQRVYFAWAAPDCAEGCGATWIGDGYCDVACNCSECGWDNGDCANSTASNGATNFGWPHAQASGDYIPHCSAGCLDTWIGDRYCDRACRNPECGMDAGDCGIDLVYNNIHGLALTPSQVHIISNPETAPPSTSNVLAQVPVIKVGDHANAGHDLDLASVFYFNLSSIVESGYSVIESAYSNPTLIRVLTLSPKNNVMVVYLTPAAMRIAVDPITPTTATPITTNSTIPVHAPATPTSTNTTHSAANQTATFSPVTASNVPKNRIFITFSARDSNRATKDYMFFLELYKHAPSNGHSTSVPAPSHPPAANITHSRQLLSIEVSNDDSKDAEDELDGPAGFSSLGADNTTIYARANERLEEKVLYRLTKQSMTKKQMKERLDLLAKVGREGFDILSQSGSEDGQNSEISSEGAMQRRLLDHYGESLKHVGRLLNQAFAPEARRVPAHMPHYLQKSVIERMMKLWSKEFELTSSHQTRAGDDMQYAFSYFWYYMGERKPYNFSEVWDTELDVNHDGVLDANEMRSVAATLVRSEAANPKPSPRSAFMNWNQWAAGRLDEPPTEPTFKWLERCDDLWVHWMPSLAVPPPTHETHVPISEAIIQDVKATLLRQEAQQTTTNSHPPVPSPTSASPSNSPSHPPSRPQFPHERLREFNITTFPSNWTMTRQQLLNCSWAMRPLEMHYKARLRNRFELGEQDEVAFFMVPTNRSLTVNRLDDIRYKRNKFICLNDNINHTDPHSTEVVSAIQEFFDALYPLPSPFELPQGQTNKYLHTSDLFAAREAIRNKRFWLYVLLGFIVVLLLIALRCFAKRSPGTGKSQSHASKYNRSTNALRHPEPLILSRGDF